MRALGERLCVRRRLKHRCKHCDALLAKHDRDDLALRCGDFQIAVTGSDFTASDRADATCQAINPHLQTQREAAALTALARSGDDGAGYGPADDCSGMGKLVR